MIHLDRQQDLYERVLHEDYIVVDYSIVYFFARYKAILIAALNFMITRYLLDKSINNIIDPTPLLTKSIEKDIDAAKT